VPRHVTGSSREEFKGGGRDEQGEVVTEGFVRVGEESKLLDYCRINLVAHFFLAADVCCFFFCFFLVLDRFEATEVALAAAAAGWTAGGFFRLWLVSLPPLFRRVGWGLVDVPFREFF
jgi:hypothetical protein